MQLKKIALAIILSGTVASQNQCFAANDNEVSPANKTQVSMSFGSYSLKSVDKTVSALGAVSLGFTYRFFPRVSAIATYNNLMTFSSNISSIVSGIDVGAQYCFFTCSAMKQKIAGEALVVSWAPWGVQVGAGFSQRSVQLSNVSVGFSGPFAKAEVNYMLGDRFKVLGTTQYTMMINSSKTLNHLTFQLGLGFDFGENIYESAARPSSL